MPHHTIDCEAITAASLVARARGSARFSFAPAALQRIAADRRIVEAYAAAGEPVYGLNTGLGGNLGYRLDAAEVVAYQAQIIQGRMVGMGEPLQIGRAHV